MTNILSTLTEGELKVARILVQECLNGMGGKRPSDLEADAYTWAWADTLIENGYSRQEAAGFWSSLEKKGIIYHYERKDYVLNDEVWQSFDAIW
jgi:hypothetical protein